ncbi:hypothetical protein [Methylobacterium oxalidis]|uniref:Uncharacterized protein n=1 Tax=Methylobacterium oxalidis TaxID=944322 RepID=A0A512JCL8_9HYPH|nr:hypothetical protein [Methylobacterium oxalidis]GEP07720.1 hypothetical protein MOX02_57580 [Methylobacterium oxalidis]GLS66495.1 hypothetical protein GCM10007888_48780 [Methylobacterium oxalidis]
MPVLSSQPHRVRENGRGSHSLYAGDAEVISGLSHDDVVAFYIAHVEGSTLCEADTRSVSQRAPVAHAGEKGSSVPLAAQHRSRRDRTPARRGRKLALMPHIGLVQSAMQQDPRIRPMTMALLLNQSGVRVHSLRPVESIMAYCSR